jgi:hypothetical protein
MTSGPGAFPSAPADCTGPSHPTHGARPTANDGTIQVFARMTDPPSCEMGMGPLSMSKSWRKTNSSNTAERSTTGWLGRSLRRPGLGLPGRRRLRPSRPDHPDLLRFREVIAGLFHRTFSGVLQRNFAAHTFDARHRALIRGRDSEKPTLLAKHYLAAANKPYEHQAPATDLSTHVVAWPVPSLAHRARILQTFRPYGRSRRRTRLAGGVRGRCQKTDQVPAETRSGSLAFNVARPY